MKAFFTRIYVNIMQFIYDVVYKSTHKLVIRWGCAKYGKHEYYPHKKMISIRHSGNHKTYKHLLKCLYCGHIKDSRQYDGSERCHRNEMLEAGIN
jgi:hypothetical protein